jgi:hypothetical protein
MTNRISYAVTYKAPNGRVITRSILSSNSTSDIDAEAQAAGISPDAIILVQPN